MTKAEQIKIISEHLQAAGDTLNETYMTAAISGALKEIREVDTQNDIKDFLNAYKEGNTLEYCIENPIPLQRTDCFEEGDIIISSDGNKIGIIKKELPSKKFPAIEAIEVYGPFDDERRTCPCISKYPDYNDLHDYSSASWYQTGINVDWEKWCVQSCLILSNKANDNKQKDIDDDRDER